MVGIEWGIEQREALWRVPCSWTQQGDVSIRIVGKVPARVTLRNRAFASKQCRRCSTCGEKRSCVAGCLAWDTFSREGRRLEILERQASRIRTLWWVGRGNSQGLRWPAFHGPQSQSQRVLFLNSFGKPARVEATLAALHMELVRRASDWKLMDGFGPRGPAGYDLTVTTETVGMLCHQGHVSEAVEAVGVLVQAGCGPPSSLLYAVLRKCTGKKDLVLGRRVHAFTVKEGYESDTFLGFHILRMYASHGRLQDATDVFDLVANPDAFTWSAIISAHVNHGEDKQAIQLYQRLRRSRVKPDGHVFVAALQACARGLDLKAGQQVHADLLASGVVPDLFVSNCLVSMYAKCGSLEEGRRVFDELDRKDVVTWNAIIAGYSQQGMGQEALRLYSVMQGTGMAVPNSVTFVCLLQACASVGASALEMGKQLHAQVRSLGFQADVFVANSLVSMYAKCGSLQDAQRVFISLAKKDVVTWTALISGYSQRGMGQEALRLYSVMQEEGIAVPNSVTFVCLLQACASVGTPALEMGKQLHLQISDRGHQADVFVASTLVNMYAKCGSMEDAQKVFDGLEQKEVVTWTALIAGYAQQGMGQEALRLYSAMEGEGVTVPNTVTLVSLLHACASVGNPALEMGKQLHTKIRQQGYEADVYVANSLVNMYAKCGNLGDAQRVFDRLSEKDVVTWTSLISGYSQSGMGQKALHLYSLMQEEGMAVPNSVTFVSLLQACASVGASAVEIGKQLHTEIKERGHEADVFVGSSLVNMYAKCGSLKAAQHVFDGLDRKDVVSWTALIAGYSQHSMGQEALHLFNAMQEEGIAVPNSVTFVCLLQACATVGIQSLEMGKQLHMQIRERGYHADVTVANSLVNMYAKCGSLEDAHRVFVALVEKDVVTWNAMIAGYSQQGMGHEALRLYSAMQEEGIVVPNSVTFVCLLQACASVGTPALETGKELHTQIRAQGHEPDALVGNSLVNMYAKCSSVADAQNVFDRLVLKDVATWNAMIAAYYKQGMGKEALGLYSAMQEEGISIPDAVTFVCLLQACATVGPPALEKGKQLYAEIKKGGHQADRFVANCLVNMFAKCGSLGDAQGVFDGLTEKDVVTWNAMMAGYSQQGMGHEALLVYSAMEAEGIAVPDSLTSVFLLQACASMGSLGLEQGKQLHMQITEQGHQAHMFVASSLVNMYAKCGSLDDAQSVFVSLGEKDVVTWNAMIAGYSHQGMGQEALRLYNAMRKDGITVPNSATFVSVLQACANVAALLLGRQLHAQIEQQGLQGDLVVGISLINMYGKCGSMVDAQEVFDTLPERDVVAWNALIAGYTCQGDSDVVLCLLRRMQAQDGIQPVGITFLSVLTVCSHAGRVDEGREYFKSMSKHYGITPAAEHYTCMVDLLGRAGHVQEAVALAMTMPVPPSAAIWHTLLGACRKWGNLEVGLHAFEQALMVDETDAAAYLLMSNIYTGAEMWEQARKLQARSTGISPLKQPGQSWWTDMDGLVHSFLVGADWHSQCR